MATSLSKDSSSPMRNDSGVSEDNQDHSPPPLTSAGPSKHSDSSSEDEHGKGSPSKSIQNTTSPQSQKRPMNAFLIFCKRHRSVVRQKYPHLENRSITKILGEWWAALDGEQKQKYTELARQYKEAFMKANPHFKWYKTDLRPPTMQLPASPPPTAPSVPPPPVQCLSQNSSQQNQSTPKPPKKRYLENGEFKGTTTTTTTTTSNSSSSIASASTATTTNAPTSGPPILDIETANRVIENALSGSISNAIGHGEASFNSELISGHINSVIEQHSNEMRDKTEKIANFNREDSLVDQLVATGNSSSSSNNNNNCSHPTTSTSNNSATNSQSPLPMLSDDDDDMDNDDDKPLNLSSSTVLHTSNQHIIDHFIEKMLNTGIEGTSTPSLSLPFTTSPPSQYINSAPLTSKPSIASPARPTRRERTCKGKRYLAILNENKLAKRNRALSPSGVHCSDKNDSVASRTTSNSIQSTSKWVSGGFDLEEHIAALPQLGDTHLLNALSHSKTKSISGASNKGLAKEQHNCKKEAKEVGNDSDEETSDNHKLSDQSKNISKLVDDIKLTENTPKIGENQMNRENRVRKPSGREEERVNNCFREKILASFNENAEECERKAPALNKSDDGLENGATKAQDLRHSQGIECDGLAALAEVALSQARNSIS